MKKIFPVLIFFLLLTVAVQAQRGLRHYRTRVDGITRFERWQLQRDNLQFRIAQRNAERDGVVTPFERRKICKLKQKTRRDAFRFRHNSRNRVI
ncbi:MAG: hypothetical protein FJY20_05575 [Bacteroidetes bacterium]|nr:hypothetical protein [Bacteroidota bacterium]